MTNWRPFFIPRRYKLQYTTQYSIHYTPPPQHFTGKFDQQKFVWKSCWNTFTLNWSKNKHGWLHTAASGSRENQVMFDLSSFQTQFCDMESAMLWLEITLKAVAFSQNPYKVQFPLFFRLYKIEREKKNVYSICRTSFDRGKKKKSLWEIATQKTGKQCQSASKGCTIMACNLGFECSVYFYILRSTSSFCI